MDDLNPGRPTVLVSPSKRVSFVEALVTNVYIVPPIEEDRRLDLFYTQEEIMAFKITKLCGRRVWFNKQLAQVYTVQSPSSEADKLNLYYSSQELSRLEVEFVRSLETATSAALLCEDCAKPTKVVNTSEDNNDEMVDPLCIACAVIANSKLREKYISSSARRSSSRIITRQTPDTTQRITHASRLHKNSRRKYPGNAIQGPKSRASAA